MGKLRDAPGTNPLLYPCTLSCGVLTETRLKLLIMCVFFWYGCQYNNITKAAG